MTYGWIIWALWCYMMLFDAVWCCMQISEWYLWECLFCFLMRWCVMGLSFRGAFFSISSAVNDKVCWITQVLVYSFIFDVRINFTRMNLIWFKDIESISKSLSSQKFLRFFSHILVPLQHEKKQGLLQRARARLHELWEPRQLASIARRTCCASGK